MSLGCPDTTHGKDLQIFAGEGQQPQNHAIILLNSCFACFLMLQLARMQDQCLVHVLSAWS